MEGQPVTVGNTVTRSLYVLDGGSNTSIVSLNVFKKTDTITSNSDTVSITPSKKLTLPLTGGSNALCSMAANDGFVFIGTNASQNAVKVNKLTYSLTKLPVRKGGYAFDCWTPEEGFSCGYTYGRIEDAHYARKVEIRSRNNVSSDRTIACSTFDEFVRLTI